MTDAVTEPSWTPKLNALLGHCSRATSSCFPSLMEKNHTFQELNARYPFYKNTSWASEPAYATNNDSRRCEVCNFSCGCCVNGDVASGSSLGTECYSLARKCAPHPSCKYESFLVDPHTSLYNHFNPTSFLSDSPSSTEDDSFVFPSALEYYSDSATNSRTSSICELSSVTSSQIRAHINALSLLENKRHLSRPVVNSNSPLKTKSLREVVSPFCPSLFHNVPPTIHFCTASEDKNPLPVEVRRLLNWKLSPITPVIVRQIVVRSGFRLARKSTDWSGTWGKHMKSIEFRFIRDVQKVNHFPGSHHLGRKDNLLNHIKRSRALFKDVDYDFLPETYLLPKELKQLHQSWKLSGSRQAWIVKPPASARGSGIYLISKWSQVPKKHPSVIQRYITNPYLINGSKFDLRVYVLVTDFNPLKIYVYPDGLVRFASVKYSTSLRTLSDRFMHLTNYSVNKKNAAYVSNEDEHSRQGHKWTLKALWGFLADRGEDVDSLWKKIIDIIIKTIVSAEGSFNQLISHNVTSSYTCFELFGFDIMLDSNLKPWLLEVNISPSLHAASNLDTKVKSPLVKDMFNIVGYHIPERMNTSSQQNVLHNFGLLKNTNTLCINRSFYHNSLTHSDKIKQEKFMSGQKKLSSILDELSPDDVRKLMQSEDEFSRRGQFIRVFPCASSLQYLELMLSNRYYNLLLLAWELQYSSNKEEGIRHLQSFALADYHLKKSLKLPVLKDDSTTTDSSEDATNKTGLFMEKQDGYRGTIGKLAYKTGSKTKRNRLGAIPRKVLRKIIQQNQESPAM